jgi:hypothetical protein
MVFAVHGVPGKRAQPPTSPVVTGYEVPNFDFPVGSAGIVFLLGRDRGRYRCLDRATVAAIVSHCQ